MRRTDLNFISWDAENSQHTYMYQLLNYFSRGLFLEASQTTKKIKYDPNTILHSGTGHTPRQNQKNSWSKKRSTNILMILFPHLNFPVEKKLRFVMGGCVFLNHDNHVTSLLFGRSSSFSRWRIKRFALVFSTKLDSDGTLNLAKNLLIGDATAGFVISDHLRLLIDFLWKISNK